MADYVPRSAAAVVRRALRTFPAVVLTGARQTGKTTLLRNELGSRFSFQALDDPDVRARAIDDPRAFLGSLRLPCILDEIQAAPVLLPFLKNAIDADRAPGRWILTGSQVFQLMAGVAESLAGRAAILHLHGLSQVELGPDRQMPTASELLRGAMPEPRLSRRVDLRLWMGSYVAAYLERDVRQVTAVGDLATFERFLRLCAARTGGILNLSQLARDAAVSPATAERWISILEAGGQFVRLPSFARHPTKRMVKAPKLFAGDTGIAAYLTGYRDEETLWHGPMQGALFETAVFGEIVKHYHHHGDTPPVSYWRSSDGLEVDFVIELGGRLHALEAKANQTPMPAMADSLHKWRAVVGERAGRTALVCDAPERVRLSREVVAVPWREVGDYCRTL